MISWARDCVLIIEKSVCTKTIKLHVVRYYDDCCVLFTNCNCIIEKNKL